MAKKTIMLNDRDPNWMKATHAVRLGPVFKTYGEAVQFALAPSMGDPSRSVNEKIAINAMYENIPDHLKRPAYGDTSVGGNDAINPYWAFNEDDDIILPIDATNNSQTKGMGCVYKEMYEANQQLLWLSFGVPEYRPALSFFAGLTDGGLSNIMNSGGATRSISTVLGNLIGSGIGLAIRAPFLPLIATGRLASWLFKDGDAVPATKYFDFRQSMPLYFRMVNSLLASLTTGMGLYRSDWVDIITKNLEPKLEDRYSKAGLPEVLREGPDIFAIMSKRANVVFKENAATFKTTDELVSQLSRAPASRGSWFDKFTQAANGSALGGSDYIGFRIEKGTSAGESFSNNTGESGLASKINAKTAEQQDTMFHQTRPKILKGISVFAPSFGSPNNNDNIFEEEQEQKIPRRSLQLFHGTNGKTVVHNKKTDKEVYNPQLISLLSVPGSFYNNKNAHNNQNDFEDSSSSTTTKQKESQSPHRAFLTSSMDLASSISLG